MSNRGFYHTLAPLSGVCPESVEIASPFWPTDVREGPPYDFQKEEEAMNWEVSGKSWGARAWDWAIYQESLGSNAVSLVLSRTGVGLGTRMLDIACGSGWAVAQAAAMGAEAVGLDASEELLSIGRERTRRGHFVRSPMEELPFEDETFDVVTSFNGLQFGGESAFSEAIRVLHPRGTLAMTFWSDFGDFGEYFQLLGNYSPPGGSALPTKFKEHGVAEKKFDGLGLKEIRREVSEVISIFRNKEDAFRGMASAGPAVVAIDYSGENIVRIAMDEYLEKFTDRDSGRVKLIGTFSTVFGRKP